MPQLQRPVFREPAWQHHLQKRDKDILPHFVSPPTFVCTWILLCLVVGIGLFASTQEVPVLVNGVGLVLSQEQSRTLGSKGGMILVFLPASEAKLVHVGEPSRLQIDPAGPSYSSSIAQVEPGLLSPNDIYKQYELVCSTMLPITEPSVVVHVRLVPSLSSHLYAGSQVRAQIQIGTQHLLSLTGLNDLLGD
jgi:hypothetical protein